MREFIVETDMDLNGVVEFEGAGGISFKPHGELIRCKDCKYCDGGIDEDGKPFLKCLSGRSYGGTNADDYCSLAERKEE